MIRRGFFSIQQVEFQPITPTENKRTVTWQGGREIHETKRYDAYGNVIAESDGEGRIITKVHGANGRLEQMVDIGGRITFYDYDDQGNLEREWNPTSGKDIRRGYDDAGRLLEVDDRGTGVKTVYTYDIDGNRKSETLTGAGAHNRSRGSGSWIRVGPR